MFSIAREVRQTGVAIRRGRPNSIGAALTGLAFYYSRRRNRTVYAAETKQAQFWSSCGC